MPPPRVAFFPDSFHEVNGVAHTSRNFARLRRRAAASPSSASAPALRCNVIPTSRSSAAVETLELARSPGLHRPRARPLLRSPLRSATPAPSTARSAPSARTSSTSPAPPSSACFGAWSTPGAISIPLAASWHTNVHEYAGQPPARWLSRHLAPQHAIRVENTVERLSAPRRHPLLLTSPGSSSPPTPTSAPSWSKHVPTAPATSCSAASTPTSSRPRDVREIAPKRRLTRDQTPLYPDENTLLLGFVGRLSIEKNVVPPPPDRSLATAASGTTRPIAIRPRRPRKPRRTQPASATHARRPLRRRPARRRPSPRPTANMDLLVLFPSHTDTFGNVVLEALASGVPAVVTPDGGPRPHRPSRHRLCRSG